MYKQNRCAKPNPWIEHLVLWGGRGLSRRQLQQKYRTERKSVDTVCRRVRNRSRDWKLDAEAVAANMSAFLDNENNRLSEEPLASINMAVLRRKVVTEMSKRSNRHRLDKDFDESTLEKEHLIRLAKIIDDVYWNGTLIRAINKRISDGNLDFVVADQEDVDWEGTTEIDHNNDIDMTVRNATIVINSAKFTGRMTRRSSGILAANKLDALSITVQHELMHALASASHGRLVIQQGQEGHGLAWRRAWRNFHGGSLNEYYYTDQPTYYVVR